MHSRSPSFDELTPTTADTVAATEPILEVKKLRMSLSTRWGTVTPVDDVSFCLRAGETLGIVGESGSGKTMTALSLMRLNPQPISRIVQGEILLDGDDILKKSEKEMRAIRGRKISMILQDPNVSLNPVFTIGNQLLEALARRTHSSARKTLREQAEQALSSVQIADAGRRLKNFPHELSGGTKQRIVGAIAMACNPKVIIADEPTTALDATIQLQFLLLFRNLQAQTGMSIILITHDFDIVARMCHRVAVMYAGRLVETASVQDIFQRPLHPYTESLIASVPTLKQKGERLYQIEGQPPQLHDLPTGCRFQPRCRYAKRICTEQYPPEIRLGEGHTTSCWQYDPSWKAM